jgi:uncharacterized protein (TIGR02646 family)
VIPIQRLPEPEVLTRNKERWSAAFLAQRVKNPQKRPSSGQYAHPEVVSTLEAMSHHKCFYCEQSTKQAQHEVDHHVDVAEDPTLAFLWTNLYLSCWECNRKKQPHRAIPVTSCLDPCDTAVRPSEHMSFDNEFIRARDGSAKGLATIKKYNLDRPDLDHKRVRQLRLFDRAHLEIKDAMIAEGRKEMTDKEKELLRSFRQSDQPFSLMFHVHIERKGL